MSSLYSQPLTRRSTATDQSSPLYTPLDDIPLRDAPKSTSRFAAQDGVRVYSPSDGFGDATVPSPADPSSDSYFALPSPHVHNHEGAQLSRRGTTKELIGRFEAMEKPSDHSALSSAAGRRTHARREERVRVDGDGTLKKPKDKGRSPLRESFRNLLSVFKKSKPSGKEQRSVQREARARSGNPKPQGGDSPTPSRKPGPTLQIPDSRGFVKEDRVVCISPVSAHTGKAGPLLYLSRIPSADSLPVWMDCTAQLHSTHILVMWQTPGGNPSPKFVPFTACSDVRSLAPADLSPEERNLLPNNAEWKVFELLFEGRAREKFAARSLTDRATWVSAIWDAVLLAQENRTRSLAVSESVYTTWSTPVASPPASLSTEPPSEVDEPTAMSSRVPRTSTALSVDRDLPPTPAKETMTPAALPKLDMRNLSASALTTLPAPPVTPSSGRASYLSPAGSGPNSPSRTPSPSIRNLDQRSMVKQRLAQIEKVSPGAQSPTSPTARRPFSPMRRDGTGTSSAAVSILNSYMGPDPISPRSTRSGGLTTIASRMGSPTSPTRPSMFGGQKEPGSRLLGLPRHDDGNMNMLSPTSRYSGDEEEQESSALMPDTASAFKPLSVPLPPSSNSIAQVLDALLVPTQGDGVVKPILEDIRQGVEVLQGRSTRDSTNIVAIRTKMDEVLGELRRFPQAQSDGDAQAPVLAKLEQLQVDVKEHLGGLQAAVVGLGNPTSELAGLAKLNQKLDSFLQASQRGEGASQVGCGPHLAPEQLPDVLSLLREAEEQRASQMEQQTDGIRYLNELNTWLEVFVKHGTSQIEGVAAGIQQLCKELGPTTKAQDGENDEGQTPAGGGNLLSDIRQLLMKNTEREQHAADLQASVNGLISAVQDDLRLHSEARETLTTESVVGMIDRQRQDQERMLKALAEELSNDIRGERLRFVEAMKEATAINVQVHVEEFKKELTREVLLMTQEVTRLERERQGLEQQIADLFAFYAKQKKAVKSGGGRPPAPGHPYHPMGQPPLPVMPGTLMPSHSIPRRPLPSPVPSSTRMRAQYS